MRGLLLIAAVAGSLLLFIGYPRRTEQLAVAPSKPVGSAEAPSFDDRYADGTPDFLRLDSEHDRRSFIRWFTFLAEVQYYRGTERLPDEVSDCAALLRFAYREALKRHDSAWANSLRLDAVPAEANVEKYQYPFTPLGANLFRIRGGRFQQSDLGNDTFAQFADASKLRAHNTHMISRDLREARPGDLLFYKQLEQNLPFHAMIYLGASHFDGPGEWIVYHTGPLDGGPGEIRRPSLAQLMAHPSPRWRPTPGNSNFLGVYRWNILRDSD